MKIKITNAAGVEQARCTLEEFFEANPEITASERVSFNDELTRIPPYSTTVDMGAGGVFTLTRI